MDPADRDLSVDRDTRDVPGSPPIMETIFGKIDRAAVFVSDLTYVAERMAGGRTPNPNVCIEHGYALKALSWRRVIAVMNTAYGDPDEHDEEDVRPVPRRTPSNILEEDSDLGDSWAVKADAGLKSSGNNGASKKADNEGIGVLGLLHQFQKVQTEGRAGNI